MSPEKFNKVCGLPNRGKPMSDTSSRQGQGSQQRTICMALDDDQTQGRVHESSTPGIGDGMAAIGRRLSQQRHGQAKPFPEQEHLAGGGKDAGECGTGDDMGSGSPRGDCHEVSGGAAGVRALDAALQRELQELDEIRQQQAAHEALHGVPEELQRSLRVGMIGVPNAGKSVLTNTLVGGKVCGTQVAFPCHVLRNPPKAPSAWLADCLELHG